MSIKGKSITAILVAAGSSTRMKSDRSKLLMEVSGKTVIRRSLEVFENNRYIDSIVLVTRTQDMEEMKKQSSGITKLSNIVEGGADRQQSVLNGVRAAGNCDLIAIHDGARPLVTQEEVETVCEDAARFGAATLSAVPKDTIKVAGEDSFVEMTPDRSTLRNIYTPQVFDRKIYMDCVEKCEGSSYTDDCQLFESSGRKVYLSEGKYTNLKITTPEDIALAEAVLGQRKENSMMNIRIGHGYDVHKLTEGRKLIVGGVDIPYDRGLLGHSDADVLLHAVSDALLGAAALGDIGCLFPDTDASFKDADSLELLKEVVRVLKEHGYSVSNIDATLIAQKPKMKPHIPQMRQNIADACGVDMDAVSVKATTEEKMGFTGREEGISAHAVCLISRI